MFQYNISNILFAIGLSCLASCTSIPRGSFGNETPAVPDYSNTDRWAALPTMIDSADALPISIWKDVQSDSPVDIFFVHPTTYVGKAGQKNWNADLDDEKLNRQTDKSSIRYQASIFNGAGKVYAPRYRQAHLNCFYTDQKKEATLALELAYEDVRHAFQYYLAHFNHGRPFIIAAHSQGSFHAKKLLQELVDGQALEKQFIVAYLAGYPVSSNEFNSIKPCQFPEQTNCFCSWRTFKEGYIPAKQHFPDKNIVVTNPVTWAAGKPISKEGDQLGSVLRDFYKVYPQLIQTRIYEDLLWTNKPKFPGSFLLTTKNYHIADYNFFYADVRQNAQDRVKAYLGKR